MGCVRNDEVYGTLVEIRVVRLESYTETYICGIIF